METYLSMGASIAAIISVVFAAVTYKKGVERETKRATLDAFNVLQEQVLDEMNSYTKTNIKEIAEHSHSEEYKKISVLLARCEHFAVGVNDEIYDYQTVKRVAGVFLINLYDKFYPVIENKRKILERIERSENFACKEKLFDDFELLTNKLKNEIKTN